MDSFKRVFRIDCYLADKLSQYAKSAICSESNIVNVALAQLLAHGYEYTADSVEAYNCADDAFAYVSDRVDF